MEKSEKPDEIEMHQTKKGNQWHFGMKAHIGVDVVSGIVHTLVTTSINVTDIAKTTELLHSEEEVVYADAGYTGIEKKRGSPRIKRVRLTGSLPNVAENFGKW